MHILIASHSHAQSTAVLSYGLELVQRTGATCTLVYVIASLAERLQGQQALQTQLLQAQKLGLQPRRELRLGLPAEQIVHLAHEAECDLIVLGEGKTEAFFGQLITPPSERVLANAPCPVLLVRGRMAPARKFLILHSGPEGLRMLPVFLQNAGGLLGPDSEVVLLHVMSQISAAYQVSSWELQASADELIHKQAPEGEWLQHGLALFEPHKQVRVTPKVRHGLIIEEILAEVEAEKYDVIVLGNHGQSGWQTFLTDNIARQLIGRSPVPVLVVPRGDASE